MFTSRLTSQYEMYLKVR